VSEGRRALGGLPRSEQGGAAGPDNGLIIVRRDRPGDFDDDDLERLRGLADQAAVAMANARLLTDLRGEQQTRRTLAAAIVLAQEQERRRVAESLHDGPVQELVGVGLMLDALSNDLGAESPTAAADVDRAAAAAREAVRALRRAMADLHPLALEELGFAAATRSLVERLEWRGVELSLDLDDADALSETQRAVAFRIVQEAVANIWRHADPTRVGISARAQEGAVVIEVTDDGRGFDPDSPRPGVAEGHLGLAAVEERAALAGGELTILSAEGRGTTIRLVLPSEG
jgi:signal transduction histidine kinase